MKRMGKAFRASAWAWKTIIVIVWFLWATQLGEGIRNDIRNRNVPAEEAASRILRAITADELEAAQKLGSAYESKQYFESMKSIERNRLKIERAMNIRPHMPLDLMMQLRALVSDYKGIAENGAAQGYHDWVRSGGALGEEFAYKVRADGWQKTVGELMQWLMILYLRSIPLVMLLYAIRMSQRRGVFETVLADPKECVKAIVLWPMRIHKYPFNVIREIRVEAELRRVGGLFRRLKTEERLLAQRIAGSADYERRLQELRADQSTLVRRGLLIALIPALILYLTLPAYAGKGECAGLGGRDGPKVASTAHGGDYVSQCAACEELYAPVVAVAWRPLLICEMEVTRWKEECIRPILKKIASKIDHIPIAWPFDRWARS